MPLNSHRPQVIVLTLAALILPLVATAADEEEQPPRATLAAQPTEPSSADAESGANPVVLMNTSMGDIRIRLFQDKAPIAVANFLSYVDEGFYDGTIFHRVIETFVIQGGGFGTDLAKKKTEGPIESEAGNGLSNQRGTVAMARTNIVDSATSQFFINVANNIYLDHKNDTPRGFGYAVFGEVIEGMETVDKIKLVKTGARGPFTADCPLENVTILSIRRVEE
jgi:peptidyl-prolyl cis-trans isomerase B (cyclophilin B)